ncbi:MAG: ABC transporter substrate-binding protein [Opitutaceae bacterium]|jgi:iron complex transport system substrate-binding protein|nr:ABC transporter substrate-binding protein [Opitutaceae bacterium]
MRTLRLIFILCLVGYAAALRGADAVRVVSQTVGSDELLLAVAAPGQIAALSHLARDPVFSGVAEEAAAHAQITLGDAETILRHRPTLALFADYSRAELVEQVRRAGVAVMVFDRYKTLEDAHANLRRLAAALGPEAVARAERIVAADAARLAALRERLAGVEPVRVIAPSAYGVIAGADTTFQDLCDRAAAENLAATRGGLRGHAAPPAEQLLTWPVERVVLAGDAPEAALAPYRRLPPYQFMPVVREGRAAVIPGWMLGCVSHLRVEAYERLARALHPEVFAE